MTNKNNEQIKNIIKPIKEELDIFENEFKTLIFKEKNFLTDDLYSFLEENAKRLRVIFVFLFSKILNVKDNALVLKIALLVEIIHNATLLHDDIIDEDKSRRGQKAFYLKFGQKMSILEGDFLLVLALKILAQCPQKIVEIFSNRVLNTVQGELKQQENNFKTPKLEDYYKKSFEKTGNLFMAGLESLFEFSKVQDSIKENLENYLYNFCLAFQIKNDIDNFKKGCSDFKNGNYTLPLILYHKDCGEFKKIPENIEKYIKLANEEAKKISRKSIFYLDKIEYNIYKDSLAKLNSLTFGE